MALSVEIESPVPAARMYKAAIIEWHELGPKVMPEVIASAVILEGTGGVGTIRQKNFTSVMPYGYIKERLDFVDHEKFECKATIIEGGHLGSMIESASVHFKIEPTSSGGCLIKVVAIYKTVPGVELGDDLENMKEPIVKHFKAAEGYLLANPGAYA